MANAVYSQLTTYNWNTPTHRPHAQTVDALPWCTEHQVTPTTYACILSIAQITQWLQIIAICEQFPSPLCILTPHITLEAKHCMGSPPHTSHVNPKQPNHRVTNSVDLRLLTVVAPLPPRHPANFTMAPYPPYHGALPRHHSASPTW